MENLKKAEGLEQINIDERKLHSSLMKLFVRIKALQSDRNIADSCLSQSFTLIYNNQSEFDTFISQLKLKSSEINLAIKDVRGLEISGSLSDLSQQTEIYTILTVDKINVVCFMIDENNLIAGLDGLHHLAQGTEDLKNLSNTNFNGLIINFIVCIQAPVYQNLSNKGIYNINLNSMTIDFDDFKS